MILDGRWVRLRPLSLEDAEATLRWRLSRRARFLQRGAETMEQQRDWIAAELQKPDLTFIMELGGVAVGMIALTTLNHRHRSVVMGRELIGETELVGGRPTALEAELLLGDHVFEGLRFHKLWGEIHEDNLAMIQTRRYLGYTQDGVLRDHYREGDGYKDAVCVSLLESEYRAVCRPRLIALIDTLGRFSPGAARKRG